MSYEKMYAEAKKAKQLKSMRPDFLKWEKEGQQVIGLFVSKSQVRSSFNDQEYYQYIFNTDKGLVKLSLGKAHDNEVAEMFKRGFVYSILFNGKTVLTGGRQFKEFEIEEVGEADASDVEVAEVADGTE